MLLFLNVVISDIINTFRGVTATLPILVYFRSLVLSVTNGINARSLTIAVEILVSRGLDNGSGYELVFGRTGINFCGNKLLNVATLIYLKVCVTLFGNFSITDTFLVSKYINISLLISVIISDLINALIPVLFRGVGISPTISSNPLVAAIGSLITIMACCNLS